MDKVKNKEWLENEFESAFDDNTAPTGGGYEADYTDKWGFYRKFEPCIIEYATQQSRIEVAKVLEFLSNHKLDFQPASGGNFIGLNMEIYTPTEIDNLYLLKIKKK